MKLMTLRDEFLTWKAGKGKSRETLKTYGQAITRFVEFSIAETGRDSATHFTPQMVAKFLHHSSGRGLKPNTLHSYQTALCEFGKWGAMVSRRHWDGNPLDHDDVPHFSKPKTLPRPFSPDERDRFMALPMADSSERVLRGLLYLAGMRSGTAVRVQLGGIRHPAGEQLGSITVKVKGGKEISHPMHPDLWREIAEHVRGRAQRLPESIQHYELAPTVYVLAKDDGTPWTVCMVQARVKRWARALALDPKTVVPHRFRHSFATDLLGSGKVTLLTLKELLGHESVATTQIYAKVTDPDRDAAIRGLTGTAKVEEPKGAMKHD